MYVEGLKIKNYHNFKFNQVREFNLEIAIYDNNININKMFKNIDTLMKIEMTSESLDELIYITSMESTFENCISLTSINISGFSLDNVTSMHKLFSGSSISSIDLSIFNAPNVTDISFMFAN